MFCEKCGKEIDESLKFCPYCGQQAISDGVQGEEQTPSHKGGMKKWVLAASALLVACFFVIGAIMMGQNRINFNGDLEALQSCSSKEIVKYGFKGSTNIFFTEDMAVTLNYDFFDDTFSAPYCIMIDDIEGADKYSYHGIKIGMDMQEAIEAAKDAYTVYSQNEDRLILLNAEGDVVIAAYGTMDNIIGILVYLGKEDVQSFLDCLEDLDATDGAWERQV